MTTILSFAALSGAVHGDLRAEMILLGEGGAVTLLVPAFASAPGALLRARLNPGGARGRPQRTPCTATSRQLQIPGIRQPGRGG